jgi:hypothetical protein
MESDTTRNLVNAANALSAAADALLEMSKELEREREKTNNELKTINCRLDRNDKFRRDLASFLQSYTD